MRLKCTIILRHNIESNISFKNRRLIKMKKLLSLIMATAMIMSVMAISVSAAVSYSFGDIVTVDGSKIDEELTGDIAPGSKVWVVIGVYDKNNPVKKVKVTPDSDGKDWMSKDTKATVEVFKSGSTRYECAQVKIKTVSLSSYDEDDAPYTFDVEFDVQYKSSGDFTEDVAFSVAYGEENAYGTISEQAALFVLEKGDELDISDEDGYITLEGEVVGDTKTLASLNTDVIDKIEDKYGDNANLMYFNFDGSFKRVRKAVLTIDPGDDDYKYLYEYNNGSLENISKYYDKSDDCFYIDFDGSSFELGTYIVSDSKLSGASTGSVSSSSSSSSSTSSSTSSGSYNNPMTGAVA